MPVAIALHVLSAVVWVGGMFFVYVCLRPSLGEVKATEERLSLICLTMGRFFAWVWGAVILLPLTGVFMAASIYDSYALWPLYIKLMLWLGLLMIALFLHVYFAPFRRFRRALSATDLAGAGRQLEKIRLIVGINLILGIVVSIIASAGRVY